jgi:hypothetical protein
MSRAKPIPLFCKIGLGALSAVALAGCNPGLVGWWDARLFWDPAELRWQNVELKEETRFSELLNYGSQQPPPRLEKYVPNWREPTVSVYSAPSSKPAAAPLTLKDLSDGGQAHAIDFVAKAHGSADTAWRQLAKTVSDSDSNTERRDPYRVDRVLVATVTKGLDSNPGDRFVWTRIFVQPINFQFAGYTLAATDNQTLTIANVENTGTNKLTLDIGLDARAGLSKADASGSIERTNKTTTEVDSQYEKLGVDIGPHFLRIIRESAPGGDVAGNTAMKLSILTDPDTIRRTTFEATDVPRPAPKLVLRVLDAHLSDGTKYVDRNDARITVLPEEAVPHCPLKARIWMLYERRMLKSGEPHYMEGRQKVKLIKDGEPVHEVEIVPADDVSPAIWSIRSLENETLKAKTDDGEWHDLVFTDPRMASELIHWLKVNHGGRLQEMQFSDLKGQTWIPHKQTDNECDDHLVVSNRTAFYFQ